MMNTAKTTLTLVQMAEAAYAGMARNGEEASWLEKDAFVRDVESYVTVDGLSFQQAVEYATIALEAGRVVA